MKQILFLCVLNIAVINFISAQQACEVKLKNIAGEYSGTCDKGLASGTGKSVGIDKYEGEFKNGFPEGMGTYTWKDGHYYIGNFKKGNKEGSGEIHFGNILSMDSIIAGFWKKDKYFGKYEQEYIVYSQSSGISRMKIDRIGTKGRNIELEVHQLKSTTTTTSIGDLPIISSVIIGKGNFLLKNLQAMGD